MNITGKLLTLTAMFCLTACGGGSSGGAPAVIAPPPPPPVNQASGGIWYGTLRNDMNMVAEEFVALTADDGSIRLISVDSDVQFHGTVSVTGTNMSGTVRAFADSGVNWLDGNHVVDASITAVISERNSINGTWENASGEFGGFEFFYDVLYEKNADTGLLADVWTGYDDFGNPDVTFTINPNGSFSGQNATGCVSNGQFTVLNSAYNLYEIQSQIANCAIAGSYSGLAVLADFAAVNDALLVSIDDGVLPILLGLER